MPSAVDPIKLSIFQQQLIGTWTNQNLPGTHKGDPTSPYSYNVMVLPQDSPQAGVDLGYILKTFTYYETIRFNGPTAIAVPGSAPNRGGDYQQTPYVLFYEQQVRFAEGPGKDTIVHLENGAWLHLQTEAQQIGPYATNPPMVESGPIPPQPASRTIAKQISIPHGVSVLALGSYSSNVGSPTIPDGPSIQPIGLDPAPYVTQLDALDNYQNPQPALTNNITKPLQEAIAALAAIGTPVTNYLHCQVDTKNGGGVLNIPFEIRKARLDAYTAEYWLLSTNGGKHYDILAYTQTIVLDVVIKGKRFICARPTANVVCRVTT
jgi:hypothetical protein